MIYLQGSSDACSQVEADRTETAKRKQQTEERARRIYRCLHLEEQEALSGFENDVMCRNKKTGENIGKTTEKSNLSEEAKHLKRESRTLQHGLKAFLRSVFERLKEL